MPVEPIPTEPPSPRHPRRSWIDPRIEIRGSHIEGLGMFARAVIRAGDVVIRWGGVVMTRAELLAGRARLQSIVQLDGGDFLADPAGRPAQPDEYMNHSCDSNLWMVSSTVLAARRDIHVGDELTCDYALFRNAEWCLDRGHRMTCRCGAAACRGVVTGEDHRLGLVAAAYGDNCARYLLVDRQVVEIAG